MFGKKKNQASIPKAQVVQLYRQAIESGVSIDKLNKNVEKLTKRVETVDRVDKKRAISRRKNLQRELPLRVRVVSWLLPSIFVLVGVLLLASAVLPITQSFLVSNKRIAANSLVAPIPNEQVLDVVPVVVTKTQANTIKDGPSSPEILDIKLDYTNLSNWFQEPIPELESIKTETTYLVDIPEIDIERAEVQIGGTNLNSSLIQYPGTANPGSVGAPVIFGHSVLRQFYNPSQKNPNRYNSIFSYIMTLDQGDEIYITHNGVKFTYAVIEKTEVKPEDTFILAQRHDSRLLKLVTCTPEGTYLRRGVVTAQLVE